VSEQLSENRLLPFSEAPQALMVLNLTKRKLNDENIEVFNRAIQLRSYQTKMKRKFRVGINQINTEIAI
jgi:uncharacterized protein YcgL (UPF0745 family)